MRKPDSISEDLLRYQEILGQSEELEKDIPPKSDLGRQKRPRVGRKRTRQRKLKNDHTKLPRPCYGKPIGSGKGKSDRQKSPRSRTSRNLRSSGAPGEQDIQANKLADSTTTPACASAKLADKATSFQDKISLESLYDTMIEMVRDSSKDIDFGMLLRLLPKNIELEKRRFQVENTEAEKLLWNMQRAMFSDDIDMFFRQISGRPVGVANSIPLI